MRRSHLVRSLLVLAAAAVWWLCAPPALGGGTSYVTTHGISMQPRFHTGDLAVVRASPDYRVGQVVAYRSVLLKTVVMHRIVSRSGDRFVFKGDNNSFLDKDQPARSELIGVLVLRVPHGGTWVGRLTSPPFLGVVVLVLLAGGGAAHTRARTRRRSLVSRHAATTRSRWPLAELPDHQQLIAFVAVALAVGGLALGALSVTRAEAAGAAIPGGAQPQMTFSYSADIGRTPAYDGTTARSPDPVFRRLASTVDVQYRYSGLPGTVAVAADLSTSSGWHSTVGLAAPVRFAGGAYTGTVRLRLEDIGARAAAAARVTGMPAGQIAVAVTPRVQTASAVVFAPALKLTLTPLQLALAGEPSSLSVSGPAPGAAKNPAATVSVLGQHLPLGTARTVSAAALLAAVLVGALLALWVRLADPGSEAGRIRRRYAPLLAQVRPMPESTERAIVDLADFPTLAKLAERYGLLVLHWASSEGHTFVVQDHNVTYRHLVRAGRDSSVAVLAS